MIKQMDWLALTFISVIFRSVYGVMTKVLSNKVKASVYTQGTLFTLGWSADRTCLLTVLRGPTFGLLTCKSACVSASCAWSGAW